MYTRDEILTRTINDPLVKERMPRRFFRERYFPTGESLDVTYVRVQRFEVNSRIAGFRLSRLPAEVVGEEVANAVKYETPIIKIKTPITAESLAEQDGADNIFRLEEGESKATAQDKREARILLNLRKMIEAREEKMCVDTLSGGWTYNENGVSLTVDFAFPSVNKVTLAGGDVWGSGTEDKVADIEDGIAAVELDGGICQEIVFGRNAWSMFKSDAEVQKIYDLNNIRIGAIDETNRTDRNSKGTYEHLTMFKVSERAKDSSGTTIDLVNPNGIWFIGDYMETDIAYGLCVLFDKQTGELIKASVPIFSKDYIEGDDVQTKYIMAMARPFPIIGNPGSVAYYDVA